MTPEQTHTHTSDGHRLRITVEDGRLMLKLLHPEEGCTPPSDVIGSLGRTHPLCWAEDWMENLMPDELMHGTVSFEVPVTLRYTGQWDDDGDLELVVGDQVEASGSQ